MKLVPIRNGISGFKIFILLGLAFGLCFATASQAERLSLSGLKTQIDAIDERLSNCEQGIGGVCQGSGGQVRNVITVALEGGDFSSIQAAIDSIAEREVPGSNASPPELEVTPTVIKIAPGEYFEQLNLRSNIHLQGAGRGQSIVRVPTILESCVFQTPVMCLQQLKNVTITGLTISGLSSSRSTQAETAIAIAQSSGIDIRDNRITEVFYGIYGEEVGAIDIHNNHIPFPADAILLSMSRTPDTEFAPLPAASIVANQIDGGKINVDSDGSVKIMENIIAGGGFNEWGGVLHASGNRIIGDVDFIAVEESLFNNNTLLGTLFLRGSNKIVVVGNLISDSGFLIQDNGLATIVGNSLASNSDPIDIQANGQSTIFGNEYQGSAGELPGHNSLVSRHTIQLESEQENVTIKAGNSTITVDAGGAVTIDSKGDIKLTADGEFSVDAASINMKSTAATTIQSGSNLNLKSSTTTSVDGAIVDIAAGAVIRINGGPRVNIDGGLITLN